jgi:SAM-dependent methyltransferase
MIPSSGSISTIPGRTTISDQPSRRGVTVDFTRLADRYDRLRPADDNWRDLLDAIWDEGAFAGQRVLDVGCGTGRAVEVLASRGATVCGVDPSRQMLEVARERCGSAARFEQGRAEELPFEAAVFDRALLLLVVHLVDRSRVLPELARVLVPRGRAVITTFRPEHFERIWLARFFPSLVAIDQARFPEPAQLGRELEASGFETVRFRDVTHEASVGRDEALERLRGRYISTLWLLPEDEYRAGIARAERELPREVRYPREWTIAVADRG